MNKGWEEVVLGDIINLIGGGTPKRSVPEFWDGNIPWLSVKDFNNDLRFVRSSDEKITNLGLEKSSTKILKDGQIIISARGTIGALAQVLSPMAFNQSCYGIESKDDYAINDFLYYLVKYSIDKLKLISHGAVFDTITKDTFNHIIINLPPLPEQKAIANILGKLDDKIELNRKINKSLEEMAQALFQSWFVDFDPVIDNALAAGNPIPDSLAPKAEKRKLVHKNSTPKHTEGFPNSFIFNATLDKWIPEGWEVKSFGEVIETTIGGDWGKEIADSKHTEEVKIIRGTDIPSIKNCNTNSAPTRFVDAKKLKTRKLEVGDIVIEVSGGSPTQPTGRSLFLTENIIARLGGVVEPASFCRRFKPKSHALGVLCAEQLTFIYGIGKMWEYQNQSTGIANFQTKYFLDAEMVIVPSNPLVLAHFSKLVTDLKNKATSNENIVLTQLRDNLLPQLISGKLSVPEAMLQVGDL